jgi:hypothetical protein
LYHRSSNNNVNKFSATVWPIFPATAMSKQIGMPAVFNAVEPGLRTDPRLVRQDENKTTRINKRIKLLSAYDCPNNYSTDDNSFRDENDVESTGSSDYDDDDDVSSDEDNNTSCSELSDDETEEEDDSDTSTCSSLEEDDEKTDTTSDDDSSTVGQGSDDDDDDDVDYDDDFNDDESAEWTKYRSKTSIYRRR